MSKNKGSYWTYVVVALLFFTIGTLLRIEKELKAQRSMEQISSIQAQEKLERDAKAYLNAEKETNLERLRQAAWGDLEGDDYMLKFIAEDYHFLFFGFAIIAFGPMLLRKARSY